MTKRKLHLMDIAIADVQYQDNTGHKVRPAVILRVSAQSAVIFRITSQYMTKSQTIRAAYYPIQQWAEAGLAKASYIDTLRTYTVPIQLILHHRPIGKLSTLDQIGLRDFIKRRKR